MHILSASSTYLPLRTSNIDSEMPGLIEQLFNVILKLLTDGKANIRERNLYDFGALFHIAIALPCLQVCKFCLVLFEEHYLTYEV